MTDTQSPTPLWTPGPERIERANLTAYTRRLREQRGLDLPDYHALWHWSVEDLPGFWTSIWEYFDVQADGDTATVLGRREMPGATWFPHTRLNYAEHWMLRNMASILH